MRPLNHNVFLWTRLARRRRVTLCTRRSDGGGSPRARGSLYSGAALPNSNHFLPLTTSVPCTSSTRLAYKMSIDKAALQCMSRSELQRIAKVCVRFHPWLGPARVPPTVIRLPTQP